MNGKDLKKNKSKKNGLYIYGKKTSTARYYKGGYGKVSK
jgi:hypothetical protein